MRSHSSLFFFFFNDTATTEIYTLSLHDALPISGELARTVLPLVTLLAVSSFQPVTTIVTVVKELAQRSEEHTSELQSQSNLVCRLLLEKKKNYNHVEQDATNKGSPNAESL